MLLKRGLVRAIQGSTADRRKPEAEIITKREVTSDGLEVIILSAIAP